MLSTSSGECTRRNGEGRESDPDKAKKFLLRAPDSGQFEALKWAVKPGNADPKYVPKYVYLLGVAYEKGWKDEGPNRLKAKELYLRAADKGNAEAQYRLGCMYEETGWKKKAKGAKETEWKADLGEAKEWYSRAAGAPDGCEGHPDAQYRFERLEEWLKNVDLTEAYENDAVWYSKSADRGKC